MPLWRRLGIVGSCLLIAVGLVILVVHFVQARQPGQASSGSVTVSQAQLIEQQLQQADVLNQQGSTKAALVLYNKVLSEDPSNPHAWPTPASSSGTSGSTASVPSLIRIGRAEIETAIRDNPSYGQAHLFYGLVLENQDHNHTAAVAQFNDFLDDAPPASRAGAGGPAGRRRLQGGRRAAAGAVQPRHDHDDVSSVGARRSATTRGTPSDEGGAVLVASSSSRR